MTVRLEPCKDIKQEIAGYLATAQIHPDFSVYTTATTARFGSVTFCPLRNRNNPNNDVILKVVDGKVYGFYLQSGRYLDETSVNGRGQIVFTGQSNKTIVVDPNEPVQFEYTGQLGAAYNWREMAPQFMTPNYIDHPIVDHTMTVKLEPCKDIKQEIAGYLATAQIHPDFSVYTTATTARFGSVTFCPLRNRNNPNNDVILKVVDGKVYGFYLQSGRYLDETSVNGRGQIVFTGQSNKTIVVDPNEPVQFEYTGQLGAAYNWREMAPRFMTPNYIDHPIVGHSTLGSDPRCRLPRSFCRPADLTQNPM